MITKICSKCKLEKELSEFGKHKGGKYGLRARCKTCHNSDTKIWAEENAERKKENNRIWAKNNSDKVIEKSRKYRKNNPDKVKQSIRKWQKENPEKAKQSTENWLAKRPDYFSEYVKNNPEKIMKKVRKRRARKLGVNENFTPEMEAIVRKTFDNKCFNCDSQDNLCIDHHRPLIDGNPLELGNAVLLCRSCNSSKGPKQPHQFYNGLTLMILDYILQQQETYIDVNLNN